MARPSLYSPEVIDAICAELEKGTPLTHICAPDDMPAPRTVRAWESEMPEVAAAIARARELGEVALAEQCLAIADDSSDDFRMGEKSIFADTDHIQRSKLRIETRLKLLAKFNPKRWGDKVEVDNKHSGSVGMTILTAVPEPSPDPVHEPGTAPDGE